MYVRPKEESTVKPMQCGNTDFYLHKHQGLQCSLLLPSLGCKGRNRTLPLKFSPEERKSATRLCSLKQTIWSCGFFIPQHIFCQFSMDDFQSAQKRAFHRNSRTWQVGSVKIIFSHYVSEQKTQETGNSYPQRLPLAIQQCHIKHWAEIRCMFSKHSSLAEVR